MHVVLHRIAAQGVRKAMPHLKALTIDQGPPRGHNMPLLAAVPLPTLHSLTINYVGLRHAGPLQGYTQLKTLTLNYTDLEGVGALAQLTGLTELQLKPYAYHHHVSTSEAMQLGVVAALTRLCCLHIDLALGDANEALSKLGSLTELVLFRQGRVLRPGPLILPTVRSLTFVHDYITVNHLLCIDAPQLRHLQVSLKIHPSELPDLRRLCRGVLKACSSLSLNLEQYWIWDENTDKDAVALMEVLHQDWQPSAEALRPLKPKNAVQIQGSISTDNQWSLALLNTHCSRQCLSLLPKGLNCLHLE
jgi:hypothetical protein